MKIIVLVFMATLSNTAFSVHSVYHTTEVFFIFLLCLNIALNLVIIARQHILALHYLKPTNGKVKTLISLWNCTDSFDYCMHMTRGPFSTGPNSIRRIQASLENLIFGSYITLFLKPARLSAQTSLGMRICAVF